MVHEGKGFSSPRIKEKSVLDISTRITGQRKALRLGRWIDNEEIIINAIIKDLQNRYKRTKRTLPFALVFILAILAFNVFAKNVEEKENAYPKGENMKYILLLQLSTTADTTTKTFGYRQNMFLKRNCSVNTCYMVISNSLRSYPETVLNLILRNFDAVIISVDATRKWRYRHVYPYPPKHWSPRQTIILYGARSAHDFAICLEEYDVLFNWTFTYKLNSDIPFSFLEVRDLYGRKVGPKINMEWITGSPNVPVDDSLVRKLEKKRKAAVIFLTSPFISSLMQKNLLALQAALHEYGLKIDVYGFGGLLKCPKASKSTCDEMMERDYYFYLAWEETLCEDFVTDQLLRPLQHFTVPVVYGGANYTRFLPPYSYLDARAHSAPDLAAIMHRLILNRTEYYSFFTWRRHYSYHEPGVSHHICDLCAALHNETAIKTPAVYEDIRGWWNPDYEKRCREYDEEAVG